MVHLPRSEYKIKPWKNGLGMTEEIFVYPDAVSGFIFRISMAGLSKTGPFSHFPDIDRSLILLEGKPIKLNDLVVPLLTPVEFPGEEEIVATIETEGRDFNLMCLRGRASGKITVSSEEAKLNEVSDFCLIFALSDSVRVGELELRKYDSYLLRKDESNITIRGKQFLMVDIKLT